MDKNKIAKELYKEVKRRYSNLDELTAKMGEYLENGKKIEITEQDYLDLQAILDVVDGNFLS